MIEFLSTSSNQARIVTDLVQHLYLALVPIIIALVLSIPLGILAANSRWVNAPLLDLSSITYSIPSLALFVVMPGIIGTKVLDPINVIIALTLYTTALLFRSVLDGLRFVPSAVKQASTAMGMGRVRQIFTVELPVAVPVIAAGLRVASVSNISLVSVGALIGVGGLGDLFTYGFQLNFLPPIIVGVVLSVALALLADIAIVVAQRLATPWVRARAAR